MIVLTITAEFKSDIKQVWNIVTDNANTAWRSDLKYVKNYDEYTFTEVSKNGYEIDFKITSKTPYKQYSFEMESKNSSGEWRGIFSKNGTGTKIEFTEKVQAKNFFMAFLLKPYLKKHQKQYVADLKKALGE